MFNDNSLYETMDLEDTIFRLENTVSLMEDYISHLDDAVKLLSAQLAEKDRIIESLKAKNL